jgi:hypothetical protein
MRVAAAKPTPAPVNRPFTALRGTSLASPTAAATASWIESGSFAASNASNRATTPIPGPANAATKQAHGVSDGEPWIKANATSRHTKPQNNDVAQAA